MSLWCAHDGRITSSHHSGIRWPQKHCFLNFQWEHYLVSSGDHTGRSSCVVEFLWEGAFSDDYVAHLPSGLQYHQASGPKCGVLEPAWGWLQDLHGNLHLPGCTHWRNRTRVPVAVPCSSVPSCHCWASPKVPPTIPGNP